MTSTPSDPSPQLPASPLPAGDQLPPVGAPAASPQDAPLSPPPGGYGPPPAPGYGAYAPGPYAGYPPAAPPAGAWGRPYAHWGYRVLATLVDFLYILVPFVVMIVGSVIAAVNAPTRTRSGVVVNPGNAGLVGLGVILALLGFAAMLGIWFVNLVIVQGRSGQSWGKRRIGLRVIHEHTGAPLSMGMNFVRYLCHYVDGILYLGYLWPLWDPKRQTFADKIMTTVVVKER